MKIHFDITTADSEDSAVRGDGYEHPLDLDELTDTPISVDKAGNVIVDQDAFADWWMQGFTCKGIHVAGRVELRSDDTLHSVAYVNSTMREDLECQ